MTEVSLDPHELEAMDARGYHVVRAAFAPELLDELEDSLVRHERCAVPPEGCPRSWTPVLNECRLMNVLECGAPFERLIDHAAILPWVNALVRGPARLTAAFSITRARGVGLPLHRVETATYDERPGFARCDQLTAAVWLSDCGPEDGPMVVFEGSHRSGAGPPPCSALHPAWSRPAHDRAFDAYPTQLAGPERAWEELEGYRELCVRRGDLILFAESLWHGAREVRSARVRRSLYLSYSPYHFANWHGLSWSAPLKARVSPAQRALLAGPFIGTRFPGYEPADVPERAEFPRLPDSELGPRVFPAPRDAHEAWSRIALALDRAVGHGVRAAGELGDRSGACVLHLGHGRSCTLELRAGALTWHEGNGQAADAVIEVQGADFAGLLSGEVEAVELFYSGRARVRGDMSLAMRLTSFLLQVPGGPVSAA